jgi:RNA-directed DNA polymerase
MLSWTGIDRNIMVKDAASPDDPALTGYRAKRRQRMKSLLDEYALRLLTRQDARYTLCRGISPREWERRQQATRAA